MTPVDYRYGWGVYSLPMFRDLAPGSPLDPLPVYPAGMARSLLVKDTPWRALIFSFLMACLSFVLLLVLGQDRSEPLQRTEPEPVKVTVIVKEALLPQPDEVPVPAPVRKQTPPPVKAPEVKKPIVQELPAKETEIQEPPKVVRAAPTPPPKPTPVIQTKPEELTLPKPTQVSPRISEKPAKVDSTLSKRAAELPVQAEESLPVAPSIASYGSPARTGTAAALPQQSTSFSSKGPASDLVANQPAPQRVAKRALAKETLPSTASVSIGGPTSTELNAVNTGLANARYDSRRTNASMPAMAPRETVATGRAEEAKIGAPQVGSIHSELDERAADSQAPASVRSEVAFSSAASDEPLIGPSANVISTTASQTSSLPVEGGSFDFLDFIGSSELDRSVMVSLNKLKTCLDPEAETKLKTRLAAMLSQPEMCRSGGVVFDIRNPESAYSIHIDLYNYEHKEFKDRCDALTLAVQSCEARR